MMIFLLFTPAKKLMLATLLEESSMKKSSSCSSSRTLDECAASSAPLKLYILFSNNVDLITLPGV
jgi:hypothetical protein